jgi:vacuolar-type H+-ATPase subunit C/Vma6
MFNIDNGYLEGLCRGFKNGILRQADYLNLVQCETLEDLKLHLQAEIYFRVPVTSISVIQKTFFNMVLLMSSSSTGY